MVEEALSPRRLAKYGIVGIIPFSANVTTIIALTSMGVGVLNVFIPDITIDFWKLHGSTPSFRFGIDIAVSVSFLIGGQVGFWSHDRLTFSDRHVSLTGWQKRWKKYMHGQAVGIALNLSTGFIIATFAPGTPRSVAWLLCTVIGALGTYLCTNLYSHAALPADPALIEPEEPQE